MDKYIYIWISAWDKISSLFLGGIVNPFIPLMNLLNQKFSLYAKKLYYDQYTKSQYIIQLPRTYPHLPSSQDYYIKPEWCLIHLK